MTIQEIENNGWLLFKTLSGSRSYGTNKSTSDYDYRGVYILPIEYLLGFRYIDQVSDNKNDIIYYEIGRFLQLLENQNPNIIELFNMPDENIVYKHPLFHEILKYKEKFLSKVCRDSFGGYAIAQIKKARGLNKKIVNPVEKERKGILDFCYIITGHKSIPLKTFLNENNLDHRKCGLIKIDHARDVYSLFYDTNSKYKGIINQDETSNEVRLSSVDKSSQPIASLVYNMDGYVKYCKDYKEYWNWVNKRNIDRFQTNLEHGKGYDSKNMMHCIRLTRMAVEIAEQKKVIVKRPDAEELLKIRNGEMEYDDLLNEAENKIVLLDTLYEKSDLPDKINPNFVNDILVDFRKKYYNL